MNTTNPFTDELPRRVFVGTLAAALASGAALAGADESPDAGESTPLLPDTFPAQDPEEVRRIVGFSHGNIKGVKALLAEDPELAKAAWDWGFGDWETALGAAAHTGRREIAMLLLDNGARQDIFSAAMLGQVEVVRSAVEAQPGIQRTNGPHSITLMRHALAGGEHATGVVEYLRSIGGSDERPRMPELTDNQLSTYFGHYRFSNGDNDLFIVSTHPRNAGLTLQRGEDGTSRQLFLATDSRAYFPAGAPNVRITFDRTDQDVRGLHIAWPGGRTLSANRTG